MANRSSSRCVESVAPWWVNETEIPLAAAPQFLPKKPDGSKISVSAVFRHSLHGVQTADGSQRLRFRRFRSGGRWHTTVEELRRWQAALTEASGGDL